ncbi:polymeric immunoglobulin receptor-like isoform X2 [Myxocyprinus asiaticus]|uniref:polymeric immunoglobulin receptor-like isoform X2 n=1 Tax=Myxocyprinus asiaticus TaxID=70543 RepID=UPI002222CFC7|nr:polymeric immunoglobulin receptor-like isoform X2 [Myxocyprinus asiaticus]
MKQCLEDEDFKEIESSFWCLFSLLLARWRKTKAFCLLYMNKVEDKKGSEPVSTATATNSDSGGESYKMVTDRKASIFYMLICFYLILGIHYSSTSDTFSVQTGGSVTIPCHYKRIYKQQRKYLYSDWNHSNKYINYTEENLSVIDYPDQGLFTVTMRNLQEKHSGRYCCNTDTGEPSSSSAVLHDFYLQIKSVPGISVVSSSVTGQEGGNISVQCFYTYKYKTTFKRWCRYKGMRCYTVGKTDTSQNPSVQISDDGRESFTVVMTGLRESDSGWYWCAVQDLMIPVQLIVNKRKPVSATTDISTEKDIKGQYAILSCCCQRSFGPILWSVDCAGDVGGSVAGVLEPL